MNRKDINTAARGVSLEHRHFAFIAATIAAMPDHAASLRAQKASVAASFADACKGTNPRFDRDRFIAACKLANDPLAEVNAFIARKPNAFDPV